MTELWGNICRVLSRLQTSKGSPYRAAAGEIELSTDSSQGPGADVSHQQILLLLDCEACSEQPWEFLHMRAANAIVQITNKYLTKAITSLLPNLLPEHATLCIHRASIACKCFSKHQQQQTEIHKSLAFIKIISKDNFFYQAAMCLEINFSQCLRRATQWELNDDTNICGNSLLANLQIILETNRLPNIQFGPITKIAHFFEL